ncbi:MAG TPA: hypothetical protein VFU98_14640 [Microlunatus sp.]|nr:hypothetical protein [Microlunatus sp.]
MTTTELPVQVPVGADGLLLHDGDHVAQLALALENLELALSDAGSAPIDLVELRIRTIDRRLLDDAYEVLTDRLAVHGVQPRVTVHVVDRLEPSGAVLAIAARVGGRSGI